jgi:hypothetical protein
MNDAGGVRGEEEPESESGTSRAEGNVVVDDDAAVVDDVDDDDDVDEDVSRS